MSSEDKQITYQRDYYATTARKYDSMHLIQNDEHYLALRFLDSAASYLNASSILDVGSGTGRVISFFKETKPNLRVVGVEPVKELREVGYSKGLSTAELTEGDGNALHFADGEFDIVCEFGVLHHVPNPRKVLAEMLRVAKIAVFISDSNNFGQGTFVSRSLKQFLNAIRLWPLVNLINTRGKGYSISEGDGLFYSFSVFNHFDFIKETCPRTYLLNTINSGRNLYRSAPSVALLGLKEF
jgi:ubiquinone/menaquinone biosynthesis C-methylase UbiE